MNSSEISFHVQPQAFTNSSYNEYKHDTDHIDHRWYNSCHWLKCMWVSPSTFYNIFTIQWSAKYIPSPGPFSFWHSSRKPHLFSSSLNKTCMPTAVWSGDIGPLPKGVHRDSPRWLKPTSPIGDNDSCDLCTTCIWDKTNQTFHGRYSGPGAS